MPISNPPNNFSSEVTSGIFWKFGELLFSQITTFTITVILARILQPHDYGCIAMVGIFIVLSNVFVTSGFSTSLIQKKDASETDFSTIFYCSFVTAIIIYIILFFFAPLISIFYKQPELTWIIRILALQLPLNSYLSIQNAYISRNLVFKKSFWGTLGGTLLSGIIGIICAYQGFEVWTLVIQALAHSILNIAILSFIVPWKPKIVFSVNAAKQLMGYGWKVMAADFSGTFFDQLRSLLIGRLYKPAELAYYNQGKTFSSILGDNIANTVMAVFFPAFANMANDDDQIKKTLRYAIKVISYIVFPLLIICAIIAPELIQILLTEKWLDSTFFIRVLCTASAISIVSGISLQVLKAKGRSDILLKLEFIKKPFYFLLLIIGVTQNVHMVAVTMLVYTIYGSLVNCMALAKQIKYSITEQLIDILPAAMLTTTTSIIMVVSSQLTNSQTFSFFIQIFVAISTYITLSLFFKVMAFNYIIKYIKERFHIGNTE